MMWTKRLTWAVTAALAMTLLATGPEATWAQHALTSAAMPTVDIQQAQALESEAQSIMEDAERWQEAASLFRQAAALRPVNDRQASEDLRISGKLAFYNGDPAGAILDLQGVANRAMISNRVDDAAHAYLDAAWVAEEAGYKGQRAWLSAEVDRILADPALTSKDLAELERRIRSTSRKFLTARDLYLGVN